MAQPTVIVNLVKVLHRGTAAQEVQVSVWDQAQIEGLLVSLLAPYFAPAGAAFTAGAAAPTPPTVAPNP